MYLETERLIIRAFQEDDLEMFKQLLDIPELPGWQMQKKDPIGFLNWHMSHYEKMDIVKGVVCFGVFDKNNHQILGAIGSGEHDDLHETEVFFQFVQKARGKGYATEATKAFLSWLMQEFSLPYVIATASTENKASQRVLEKSGFEYIETRSLLVHITEDQTDFCYYHYKMK